MFYINTYMVIIRKKDIVFVGVTYYIPDYTSILQEFYWQTEDIVPDIPRVHKFLNYWKDNIDAIIKEVNVSFQYNKTKYTKADFDGILN